VIELTCPSCGKRLRVPDTAGGKRGKCPGCQTSISVPTAAATETAAAPPVAEVKASKPAPELAASKVASKSTSLKAAPAVPKIVPAPTVPTPAARAVAPDPIAPLMAARPAPEPAPSSPKSRTPLWIAIAVLALAIAGGGFWYWKSRSADQTANGRIDSQHDSHQSASQPPGVELTAEGRFVDGQFHLVSKKLFQSPIAGLFAVSPDGTHLAAATMVQPAVWTNTPGQPPKLMTQPGTSYVVDGRPPNLPTLKGRLDQAGIAVYSPDSSRVAWVQGLQNPPAKAVVVDGQPGAEYADVNSIAFSPDSKHVAYVATIKPSDGPARYCVVVDGKAGKSYDGIQFPGFDMQRDTNGPDDFLPAVAPVRFSGDSNHVAYVAILHDDPAAQRLALVVDGNETPFDGARDEQHGISSSGFAISDDGSRAAAVGSVGPGTYAVITNGTPGPAHRYVAPTSLHFLADGRLVYLVCDDTFARGGPWYVVIGDTPGKHYEFIPAHTVVVTGNHVAYAANGAGTGTTNSHGDPIGPPMVVVDGTEKPGETEPVLDPAGDHVAALSSRDHDAVAVVDGTPQSVQTSGWRDPQFSPDGLHFAYVLKRPFPDGTPGTVVLDGTSLALPGVTEIRKLVFVDDGRLRAAVAVPGQSGQGEIRLVELTVTAGPPKAGKTRTA
jgi:hypothetical protein